MRRFLTLFIFSLFLCSSAFAKVVVEADEGVPRAFQEKLIERFTALDKLVKPELIVPTHLRVVIPNAFFMAFFANYEHMILIPHSLAVNDGIARGEAVIPAAVHEYGHYLYAINAMKREPMIREAFLPSFKLAGDYRKRDRLNAEMEQLRQKIETAPTEEQAAIRETLRLKDAELVVVLARIQAVTAKFEAFAAIEAQYDELYADLLTAVLYRDPDVIRSLLLPGCRGPEDSQCRARSFSAEFSLQDWTESESHIALASSRRAVWDARGRFATDQEYLGFVLNCTTRLIRAQMIRGRPDDTVTANADLIRCVQE